MPTLPSGFALAQDGFTFSRNVLSEAECHELGKALADAVLQPGSGGQRHLLRRPPIVALCTHPRLAETVVPILGKDAFAYKATLFDKTPTTNWKVAWHQDLSIPLCGAARPIGWRGWSVKDRVLHAQPPPELLARVLAVRLHIDPCDEDSGALRVIPGSHKHGRLDAEDIGRCKAMGNAHTCTVDIGDALLLRPLLLHASSASQRPHHRRVIHLEFAAEELPEGLEWAERIPMESKPVPSPRLRGEG